MAFAFLLITIALIPILTGILGALLTDEPYFPPALTALFLILFFLVMGISLFFRGRRKKRDLNLQKEFTIIWNKAKLKTGAKVRGKLSSPIKGNAKKKIFVSLICMSDDDEIFWFETVAAKRKKSFWLFEFELPTHLPKSGLALDNDKIRWRVQVKIKTPEKSYFRHKNIGVQSDFKPDSIYQVRMTGASLLNSEQSDVSLPRKYVIEEDAPGTLIKFKFPITRNPSMDWHCFLGLIFITIFSLFYLFSIDGSGSLTATDLIIPFVLALIINRNPLKNWIGFFSIVSIFAILLLTIQTINPTLLSLTLGYLFGIVWMALFSFILFKFTNRRFHVVSLWVNSNGYLFRQNGWFQEFRAQTFSNQKVKGLMVKSDYKSNHHQDMTKFWKIIAQIGQKDVVIADRIPSRNNANYICRNLRKKMQKGGCRLLWGTFNQQ